MNTKKNILFIPFSARENNFSLYLRALEWRHNLYKAHKYNKMPEIVLYREPTETDDELIDYKKCHFQFSENLLHSNTMIYILADGMGDDNLVSNSNEAFGRHLKEEPTFLDIQTVASRLKDCGLTPLLAQRLVSLKLFVCEENDNNRQLAINFAHSLGSEYHQLELNYYTASLYLPLSISFYAIRTQKNGSAFSLCS